MPDHDVVVVGANVAGSITAALLAQHGASVVLIEKSPDPAHHKALCTHEVIPLANPVFERLGVLEELQEIGGAHGVAQMWSRYGWVSPQPREGDVLDGVNVRRSVLDPLLRSVAERQSGVELRRGETVTDLLRDAAGRPAGVRTRGLDGAERELTARVVVGADGAASPVAEMAGIERDVRPHNRFGYAGYFEGVAPIQDATGARASRIWWLEPDMAYAFPTDADLTLIAVAPLRTPERIAAFKADLDGEFRRTVAALPVAPDLSEARQVDKYRGLVKTENVRRTPGLPGIALVGDAAQVTDFVWGAGCGFAAASAEWAADAIGPLLAAGAPDAEIDAALGGYARRHRRTLGPHYDMITSYSTGRAMNMGERLLFRGATRDAEVARALSLIGGRTMHPMRALSPRVLARAAVASARAGRAPRRSQEARIA